MGTTKTKAAIDLTRCTWMDRLGVFDGELIERSDTGARRITENQAASEHGLSCGEKQVAAWGRLEIWKTPRGQVLKKMIKDKGGGIEWVPMSGHKSERPRRETLKQSVAAGEVLFNPDDYKAKTGEVQR